MVKAILSFVFGAGLLFLFFSWVMPLTTHKILGWGTQEVYAVFNGKR